VRRAISLMMFFLSQQSMGVVMSRWPAVVDGGDAGPEDATDFCGGVSPRRWSWRG